MTLPLPQVFLAQDFPRNALHRSWRRRELVRIRRGAYLPPDTGTDPGTQVLARCVAVARTLRGAFVFSHQTAALLHGLPVRLDRTDAVHIIQPTRPSAGRAPDVLTHTVPDLPTSDVTTSAGLPVTTLERTVLDCAMSQRPRDGLITVDAALRRESGTTRFEPAREVEDRVRRQWLDRLEAAGPAHGVVPARAVIAHADGRAESPPESELRWLVLIKAFPAPVPQVPVRTSGGTCYPDLVWTGEALREEVGADAVALEYDGVAKYQHGEDLYDEKMREDALRRAGCHVIRVTKHDLRQPARLLNDLRALVRVRPGAFPERRGLLAR